MILGKVISMGMLLNALARQNLIAQRNNLQFDMLQNFSSRRGMLNSPSFGSNLESVAAAENALDMEQISNEVQYQAINAELNALKNYSSKNDRLNYLA